MSVRVMALVFECKIPDLEWSKDGEKRGTKASTAKLMLLAYADHANDEGEASYPGYDRLEIKTALSRQGIADTLEALRQNNYLIPDGVSKLETNRYNINLDLLVKPLDSRESSGLKGGVKPLDHNHPLTIPLTVKEKDVFEFFQANFELLTPFNSQYLGDLIDTYTAAWVLEALKEGAARNKKNLKYCEAILRGWKADGFKVDTRSKNGNSNGYQPRSAAGKDSQPIGAAPTENDAAIAAEVLAEQCALFSV